MRKPRAADYPTDDGLHSAMDDYAAKKSYRGELVCYVKFADGSGGEMFRCGREPKEISYRTKDGELYTVIYDGPRFVEPIINGGEPLTSGKMKAAITDWLNASGSEHDRPTEIRFELEE